MDKNKTWIINDEKMIFKTRIFEVYDLDCYLPSKDKKHNFYSLHMPNWVNISSITDDKKIILVKQHRLGKNLITFEVPAGVIDKNEDPLTAAKRELEEETGFVPQKVILLKSISVNPAIQNNTCFFYLALGCKKLKDTKFDPSEEIEVHFLELKDLDSILNSDMIDNSLSYLALMLTKSYLMNNKVEL